MCSLFESSNCIRAAPSFLGEILLFFVASNYFKRLISGDVLRLAERPNKAGTFEFIEGI